MINPQILIGLGRDDSWLSRLAPALWALYRGMPGETQVARWRGMPKVRVRRAGNSS